ncbi:7-deoxyloganetin glucosyltransferase-like isoform X2 [Corylus avellana]|uniref:7-deoxyloganetin glucosyltransferase-like isoform X2 n=1 Tax=Corylus avellana TaxID=13451 RepID=UPI00286C9475|nr:7-deoxyloganetin glucosyltransferase-like isoform X2 [Corylus avellana]
MDSNKAEANQKPHAICVPLPFQSHIKAMLKFSKLLHQKGFHITFVNTDFNHHRLITSNASGGSLDGFLDFRFQTIPDGLPPSDPNATQDVISLFDSVSKNMLPPFSDLLNNLNTATPNVNPPVTRIVSDAFMSFTITAAEKLGIPAVMLLTISASRCKLLSTAIRLKVGPLQLLLNHSPNDDPLKAVGYSLWKEEDECLHWLDSKQHNSVIYVNFGSVAVMTQQQLLEFAWGLANSNFPFLLILRLDLVIGESAILPPEFSLETKERGLIATWCPQEEALNHPPVGAFLTHCGWNSMIEGLSAGVPLLCCPFFGDQPTNCRYACDVWTIGMEIENNATRKEVEKIVRELMEGENGKKIKQNVLEWKKLAEEATDLHGSSSRNLENLVNLLLSKC